MIKKIFLLSIWLGGLLSSAETFQQQPFEQAVKQSQLQNKPIFLKFHADWCPVCLNMDRNTFTDKNIQNRLNTDFISLKINVDSKEGARLAGEYQIRAIPTIIVLSPDGSLIYRNSGFLDDQQLSAVLKELEKSVGDAPATPKAAENSAGG